MAERRGKTKGTPAGVGSGKRSRSQPPRPAKSSLIDIAQQVSSWTDSVLGVAGAAADVTLGAAKMMLPKPGQRAALEKTGASALGRNDPISFVMRFTRSYNPDVWKTLESLGIGRLAVQAGREREFANLYRASDAARRLSDEEFAEVLKFTQAAFALAVSFRLA